MTKVSVVSTVYNGAEHIDQAADSILRQDYENYEWIILDDQSTDETPKKLSALADSHDRVRVITPPERLGRAPSLNEVVDIADGHYIAQQDIDDISFPHRLSLQAEYLDDNSDVGVVGGYYERIDQIRNEAYVREPPTEHEELVKALASYIPFAHTLVMFRKEAWSDAGTYPEKEDLEDICLWINMASRGWRLGNVPENLGKHFVYEESSWHRRYQYTRRQRRLAKVQARAVSELDLPVWMYVYPAGRLLYPYLPTSLKRSVRRIVGGIREREL
jgi:glycosyltransferase involved in cell wall biosynthesis